MSGLTPPNEHALVFPMLAMVALTATTLAILFRSRLHAVRERRVSARYFTIYQGETEPESSAQAARHFANLFEAPTLFYVACVTAMVTHHAGAGMQILAWLYVAARAVHSFIHLGSNRVPHRIAAYFTSWAVLLAIWISLALGVALERAA